MNRLIQQNASDTLMWDIWTSIYHLPALTAADELGLFSSLGDNEWDLEYLANQLNINTHSTAVLVELLIGLGFITKNAGKISLTPTAKRYLMPDSPAYWGVILEPFRDKIEHKKIIQAIRQGKNQLKFEKKSFSDMWEDGSVTSAAARSFTKRMHTTIFTPALEAIKSGVFKSTKKLLDVGGGSACFSIAFTQAYPDCTATVFELPAVCEIAKEYVSEYNAKQNVSIHAGNFFIKNNWPTNYDGIILSQILHDWPLEKCKIILEHAYSALPFGGKIYIHEMLLDDNRSSPLSTACFNLLMFINHQSQQFSEAELINLLLACGFSNPKTTLTFGYFSITMATKL
ncbi:MAG: methyltransferase [Legionella sp.]|nr:methyltransferase [Legionella sp.]